MTIGIHLYHAPGEVVRALLIQLGVGSDGITYLDWPIFIDEEPDKPDNCITIEEIQGKLDGVHQPTGETIEHYGFHISIRCVRTTTGTASQIPGYRIARNKVDQVCVQLSQNVAQLILTLDNIQYLISGCLQLSSADPLGKARNNSGRYRFTVDYQITIVQLT